MTLLLNAQSLTKSFGSNPLFKNLSFSIYSGNQLGLIGPNGAGKTTLLEIIAGKQMPDEGIIAPKKGLRIGYVAQSHEFPNLSPFEILKKSISMEMPEYEKERLCFEWLSRLGFDENTKAASELSGGWKKRLGLACALIEDPDLLLLDEPTNHLDLEGVLWIEKFLLSNAKTFLVVSHDRYFLQNMTNRIIEINPLYPEGLFSIDGNYDNFLEKKELFIEGQLQQERSIASKARKEYDWLQSNAKARTTKARSRIDKAEEVLEQHSEIRKRNITRKADISFEASERETRKLIVAKNISFEVQGRTLFNHLDVTLVRGTRLGLIGTNGSGKTTLLKLLSGEIAPQMGTIKRADDLKIVHFDQHRTSLAPTLSLKEALSPHGDYVFFNGQPIHVNGWCKRFLFSPDRLNMPIGSLSGGERARIAIAHLMLKPADILLLDEPTNDLDIPTLQTLEENLMEFSGAVVLITHDRFMMAKICNLFLSLGETPEPQIFSSFSHWEKFRSEKKEKATTPEEKKSSPKKKTLSYKEKQEYDKMETLIAKEEVELQKLHSELEMEGDKEKLKKLCIAIAEKEEKIQALYARFEELDTLAKGLI